MHGVFLISMLVIAWQLTINRRLKNKVKILEFERKKYISELLGVSEELTKIRDYVKEKSQKTEKG